jgi:hypothetical protein
MRVQILVLLFLEGVADMVVDGCLGEWAIGLVAGTKLIVVNNFTVVKKKGWNLHVSKRRNDFLEVVDFVVSNIDVEMGISVSLCMALSAQRAGYEGRWRGEGEDRMVRKALLLLVTGW